MSAPSPMRLALVQPALDYHDAAHNLRAIRDAVASLPAPLGAGDVLLLPEHWDPDTQRATHLARLAELARELDCHVVGGTHHEDAGEYRTNTGYVVAPDGSVLATYDKLRPYATERSFVSSGTRMGELTIAGHRVLILVCADFWFMDLIDQAEALPDLILVPALSVTRKPSPAYSQALWQHLAIARAYELGSYVGVSDWGRQSSLPLLAASAVAGFADPTRTEPTEFFAPVGGPARLYDLDFDALRRFRDDRRQRGFFWR